MDENSETSEGESGAEGGPDAVATQPTSPEAGSEAASQPAEPAVPVAAAPVPPAAESAPAQPAVSEMTDQALSAYASSTYPDLTPCAPPATPRWNGWGIDLRGRRQLNSKDGTYLATRCVVMFMLPVAALGAYRVADAPLEGWRFLGRAKLSEFAKVCNLLVVALLCALVALGLMPNDDQRLLSEARGHEAAKRYVQAARGYVRVLATAEAGSAEAAIRSLVSGPLREAPTEVAIETLDLLSLHPTTAKVFDKSQDDAWSKLALERGGQDPALALKLLDALQPLAEAEVEAVREQLLTKLNAADPKDPVAASGLAEIYERRKQPKQARAVLDPVGGSLGSLEGARVFGMLLLVEGDHRAAARVWTPYVDAKLSEALKAREASVAAYKHARSKALDLLNTGKGADKAWFRAHNTATADKRTQMVSERVDILAEEDPSLTIARRRWGRLSRVVDVALELAVVRLALASGGLGESEQRAGVESAGDLLEKIRVAKANSAYFRLAAAKVDLLLGRTEQGKKVLAGLEKEFSGQADSLRKLVLAYRQGGLLDEARRVAEKAYAVAESPQLKHSLAELRAALAPERRDRIVWLERANPSSPLTQAALASARAEEAEAKGDLAGAGRHYREALGHQSQGEGPQTSGAHYSRASIRLRLYRLEGQGADLVGSVEDLRQAVALDPSHPLLLSSLVRALNLAAGQEVLAGRLELAETGLLPSVGQFWSVCDDSPSYEALCQAFLATSAFKECQPLLAKLLALKTSSRSSLVEFLGHAALRDEPAEYQKIVGLAAGVDFEDYTLQVIGAYHTDEPEAAEELAGSLESALQTASSIKAKGGATYALALREVLRARLRARVFGLPVAGKLLLEEAQLAHSAAPSVQTRLSLAAAHALRALERLRPDHPALDTLSNESRRTLDAPYVLVLGLTANDKVAAAILADPDVIALGEILADLQARAPRAARVWWARLLRALKSPAAEALEARLKTSQLARLRLKAVLALAPLDAEQILEQAWLLDLTGKPEAARALIAEAKEAGVPF